MKTLQKTPLELLFEEIDKIYNNKRKMARIVRKIGVSEDTMLSWLLKIAKPSKKELKIVYVRNPFCNQSQIMADKFADLVIFCSF